MTRRAAALALLLPGGLACGPGSARLEARWVADSVPVRWTAPAAAIRCDAGRLLITAAADDSGFGVLLAGADSGAPAAGRYPVADPAAGALPRPGAALALRLPGEGGSRGYQGRAGEVTLAPDGQGWRGSFDAPLVSLEGDETLAVAGRFRVAPPATGACDDSAAAELP